MQLGLFIIGLLFRGNKEDQSIGVSASESFAALLFGLILVANVYFGEEKFTFTKVTSVLLVATLVIALMMIPRYVISMSEERTWWAPIVLEIIVAHVLIYVQLAIEYFTWEEKRRGWYKDLKFSEEYVKADNDKSESTIINQLTAAFTNINVDEAPVAEGEPSISGKGKETVKISAGLFASAFFAMMRSTKHKHKLRETDQVDVLYRAVFTWTI